jgi:putative tricarboxylic transport membrane protein
VEILTALAHGFSVAFTPTHLLFCAIGVLVGTLIGILPGLGPGATLALLLPFTFGMPPTATIILMAGIYYGAMYGGSTTSILVNIPGEAASIVTCFDGYQLARQGRAGAALGMAAIASFVAGTISVVGLMLLAVPLSEFGVRFGPPEYCALMLVALTAVGFIGGESMLKSLIMACLGLLVSTVGLDVMTGRARMNFGLIELMEGISFVIAVLGLFAMAEILLTLSEPARGDVFRAPRRLSQLFPTRNDLRVSCWPITRGTLIGFVVGVMPGAGATIASFITYGVERRLAKDPQRFGKGAIEGVAAPEAANNAAAGGALVPLLALGIPGSGSAAVILGAMILAGIRPGPFLFREQADLVWGLIASLYIGNVLLLIINLPLVPLLASLLRFPYWILYPVILVLCVIGGYSLNGAYFELWLLFGFGLAGLFLRQLGFPPAPAILGIVLGPLIESSLRQSLGMSQGSWAIFVTRPIAGFLTAVLFLVLFLPPLLGWLRARSVRKGLPLAPKVQE